MNRPLNSTSRRQEEEIVCPCCKRLRPEVHLQKALSTRFFGWGGYQFPTAAILRNPKVQWACDLCLSDGHAMMAKPDLQTFCDYAPYFAYFDQKKRCKTCGDAFAFTAKEQKHWYETLKFWVQSVPVECPDCRKANRQKRDLNTALSQLMQDPETLDMEGWERVAAIYSEMGNAAKAKFAYSQIKKLRDPEGQGA